MSLFQYIGLFFSLSYMFYILWCKFYREIFYNGKLLAINLSVSTIFAITGLFLNFSVQSAGFLIPISLILTIKIFNVISLKTKGRQFEAEWYLGYGETIDKFFTLGVIFFTIILPVIALNIVINGKILD